MSILPSRGHVIFTGRPSNYQGSIAKHFSNIASKAGRVVYYRDISGQAIPLDCNHDRLAVAQAMLQGKPHALVVTAGHYGVSGKLDVSDFKSVARIWECKQHGETLQVTLTEVLPATGREVMLEGTQEPSGIAWHETNAPEPAPLGKQRFSMADGHGEGMPDAPGARTMIGEYLKANPTRKVIQL
jgi:hypothetical protein